jgi:hypothetical protein
MPLIARFHLPPSLPLAGPRPVDVEASAGRS